MASKGLAATSVLSTRLLVRARRFARVLVVDMAAHYFTAVTLLHAKAACSKTQKGKRVEPLGDPAVRVNLKRQRPPKHVQNQMSRMTTPPSHEISHIFCPALSGQADAGRGLVCPSLRRSVCAT